MPLPSFVLKLKYGFDDGEVDLSQYEQYTDTFLLPTGISGLYLGEGNEYIVETTEDMDYSCRCCRAPTYTYYKLGHCASTNNF